MKAVRYLLVKFLVLAELNSTNLSWREAGSIVENIVEISQFIRKYQCCIIL